MDAVDSTYAPQSPDLSTFFESTSKSQQPYHKPASSIASSYHPRSPSLNFNTNEPAQFTQNNQHNQYAYNPPTAFVNNNLEYDKSQYLPIPDLPAAHSFTTAPLQTHPYVPAQRNQQPTQHKIEPSPQEQLAMSSRGPRIKPDPSLSTSSTYKDPNPHNIEIKTKFPVARIKRIMQADEEVGKVAQVTPVAVSKALELFMISLVGGAADIARDKGQKRVTAQHLKAVVLGSDQFDFLTDIVGRVADVQEGAGGEKKRKEKVVVEKESESSEEEKKPKKRGGRRKKNDD